MSTEQPDAEDAGPTLARNHTVDAVVAALIFAFGLLVATAAWKLGARWASDGPGAGYFPFYIGLILCLSSLGIFVQALVGKARDDGAFVNKLQLKRVMQVLIPAAVYVLAAQFLGLYVASAIYIAAFMIILGKYTRLKSVLTGVIVCTLFFLMFEVWFKVPLFKGSLEPLRFLGY